MLLKSVSVLPERCFGRKQQTVAAPGGPVMNPQQSFVVGLSSPPYPSEKMDDSQRRPERMNSIVYSAAGDAKSSALTGTANRPILKEDEVMIEVHAFGLNYADILSRKGVYPDAPRTSLFAGLEMPPFYNIVLFSALTPFCLIFMRSQPSPSSLDMKLLVKFSLLARRWSNKALHSTLATRSLLSRWYDSSACICPYSDLKMCIGP